MRWPALMARATAAEYLDVSKSRFDQLRAALPSPVYYTGRTPRWRRTDLDAWIGGGETRPVNPLIEALDGSGAVQGR